MQLFLKLLCIFGKNLYKSDSGSKRACKKAEGLSSWMTDAVESATGVLVQAAHPRQLEQDRFVSQTAAGPRKSHRSRSEG